MSTDFNIPGLGPASATASAPAQAPERALGREEFLRLLVTQLSNQDPLNPMQGHEFAAQLAQFSSVEQLLNINETLGMHTELNALLAQSVNSGVAAGLIGKTVEASGNSLHLAEGRPASAGIELSGQASDVKIVVRNAGGQIVRELDLGSLSEGSHQFTWDGNDATGARAATGAYTFEIDASDSQGAEVSARPLIRGVVDRVTFSQDGINVWIGNVAVPMGAVHSVQQNES